MDILTPIKPQIHKHQGQIIILAENSARKTLILHHQAIG
jgi:uncharacterized protein Veg